MESKKCSFCQKISNIYTTSKKNGNIVICSNCIDILSLEKDTFAQKHKTLETEDKNKKNREQDEKTYTLNELLEELNKLTGLREVKISIQEIMSQLIVRNWRIQFGLKPFNKKFHLVFTGNPGTGKTTVARLIAKIYKSLGLLSKGHLIEASRSDLVGQFIGSTTEKTTEIIKKAQGGVLFIDEAYSLSRNEGIKDFGGEAIEILLKAMEDDRDDFIVIVAGYPSEMERFINSNPGLKSRFTTYIKFKDYSIEELDEIMLTILKEYQYELTTEAKIKLINILDETLKKGEKGFGNARDVRNLIEKVIRKQASRLSQYDAKDITKELLLTIEKEDI